MRVIKAIVLFCFSMVAVSACFEAPEMSIIPKIEFKSLQFKEVGTVADFDTLILTFNFKDGNGDIGLGQGEQDSYYPFHNADFFIGDEFGDTTRISPFNLDEYTVIAGEPPSIPYKLITANTPSQNPAYSYLPSYNPSDCAPYSLRGLLVQASLNLVDATYTIVDTIQLRQLSNNQLVTFYLVNEPFLYKNNPYHYNLEVKFWIFKNGAFEEFDWFKEYCITFDGRFPVLSQNGKAVEGTFRYAMPNSSFIEIFGSNPIRITARIRDRALHSSNLMVKEFYLDDIR